MNNAAAIGYMILAAKELSLDKKLISELEEEMRSQMDISTEEEAISAYVNS